MRANTHEIHGQGGWRWPCSTPRPPLAHSTRERTRVARYSKLARCPASGTCMCHLPCRPVGPTRQQLRRCWPQTPLRRDPLNPPRASRLLRPRLPALPSPERNLGQAPGDQQFGPDFHPRQESRGVSRVLPRAVSRPQNTRLITLRHIPAAPPTLRKGPQAGSHVPLGHRDQNSEAAGAQLDAIAVGPQADSFLAEGRAKNAPHTGTRGRGQMAQEGSSFHATRIPASRPPVLHAHTYSHHAVSLSGTRSWPKNTSANA